jgi:NADH-quinone oxidoreductase subunit K
MTLLPLSHILIFSLLLFVIGLYGALVRRNIIGILISIELMLNAANINLIAFSKYTSLSPETGQIFAIFVIAIAATAAAVGLAIVLALYRVRKTVYTDEVNLLKW